ncbi:MAG: serine/threonine-protein kinase [Deltaproteobacteria bacterium]
MGERLGRGGMGTVYAVVHEEIGKKAALKVMHDFLTTGITVERIKLEARVVNRVGHPNIVDIFETGTLDDGRPYIVMERLDGVCLGNLAFESKVLPDRVVEILIQICDALIAAHTAGVIHRDLKLDNVFLLPPGDEGGHDRVKLLDWGIAKEISNDVRCTIDGQLVGTPQYLSPEQARGAELTPATDTYSLGVMAFELFLEQLPFEAETAAEIMTMHLRAEPPRPSDLWPDIPRELEALLLAMLAKRAEDRPSLETVAGTLLHVRDELDRRRSVPRPAPAPRHTRFASAPPLTIPPVRGAKTRWQLALGACAIVASAVLFLVAQDSRSMAAPAPTVPAAAALGAARVTAPVVHTAEATWPRAVALTGSAAGTEPVQAAPAPLAHHATPPRPVATVAKTDAPRVPAVTAGESHRPHHAASPTPARSRTAANFDPDGSVDPY